LTYGPNPWQQAHWDWRAAGNFICGGAGGGLIVLTVVSGAQGLELAALLLGGVGLVGAGLFFVWLEIGRPLRALHVFFNPRTSWMTREAIVAAGLIPVVIAAAAGLTSYLWLAAALALGFVYCQARIVQAAKGIPAWREPRIVPLLVFTGLASGAGLLLLARPALFEGRPVLLALAAVLVLARAIAWQLYRQRLGQTAARVPAALDAAGRGLNQPGSIVSLLLLGLLGSGIAGGVLGQVLSAAAGALIVGTGAWFGFTLITRAGINQGFSLTHLPVRGVRR
jgi:phenylacetyl-CoA:acceptor oxidoreductase 26-kDa subunit